MTELEQAKQDSGLLYREIAIKTGIAVSNLCRSIKRDPARIRLSKFVSIALALGKDKNWAVDVWRKAKIADETRRISKQKA